MSEHRKDEPTMLTIPDRLPGEAELSELYQENADEQPSLVVDQLIYNEADKAVQPPSHLRLIFRRWTVPLTLAAGLLVSIGVMTMLQDNMMSPVVMQSERVQPMSSGQIEQEYQVYRCHHCRYIRIGNKRFAVTCDTCLMYDVVIGLGGRFIFQSFLDFTQFC